MEDEIKETILLPACSESSYLWLLDDPEHRDSTILILVSRYPEDPVPALIRVSYEVWAYNVQSVPVTKDKSSAI